MKPELSVVVVALDEEERIASAVEPAVALGFSVVVVDGGSSDGTAVAATEAGATVLTRPFDDHASQRNWAMEQVTTPYVLFVDADEEVTPELAEAVREAVERGVDGASVPTLDYFAGRWMRAGGWFPQRHVRLVRRDRARFVGMVHESIRFARDPVLVHLDVPLLHRSHLSVGHFLRKMDLYTEVESAALHGRPGVLVLRGIIEAAAVIVRRLVLQRGYRDGIHGVIGAILHAGYRFVLHAKAATADPAESCHSDMAMSPWRGSRAQTKR